jgi:acetylornithine deacetylase/succinyl-diaminopimelate desuccinylase-like protein
MTAELAHEYQQEIHYVLGRSVADTSHFAFHGKIPTVICGPQGGNTCEANEWIDLDSLLPTTRAMIKTTLTLLSRR